MGEAKIANIDKLKLLVGCVLVGVLVALTYFVFEALVRQSITIVWDTVFHTADMRWVVLPLCVGLTLLFFALQHRLDPGSQDHEKHGLGSEGLEPTLKNLLVILGLGYLSLLAGASLGPEAVLVPACMVIGAYTGLRLIKNNNKASQILAAAAIMALMAAFFHSFIIGVASLVLVTKQTKVKISPALVAIAVISSASSFLTLHAIDPENRYFNFPTFSWKVALLDLLAGSILMVAGFASTFVLKYAHTKFVQIRAKVKIAQWWRLALLAGVGLSVLYLVGGPLVQFTGNESIAPLVHRAPSLGLLGLVWILIIKLAAISWSKAMGYRGGLIFPMIFVASTLVAASQILIKDTNFGVGLIAAMIGILAAEKRAKILL